MSDATELQHEAEPAEAPVESAEGRGLNRRALMLMAVALVVGGVISRVVNLGLDHRRAEVEHQRHLARVERDQQRIDSDDIAAQIAEKRAKRGLPRVEAPPAGAGESTPVQAN